MAILNSQGNPMASDEEAGWIRFRRTEVSPELKVFRMVNITTGEVQDKPSMLVLIAALLESAYNRRTFEKSLEFWGYRIEWPPEEEPSGIER